ncbi:hypothetical protein DEU56DRAFT_929802 [Suillus clintonianus]|uniref:uncharacterized protein n=1 Tax=Suillus clintonianus TaxID=1904413 RepID=UPI001B85B572|nr:uncharacterized protein DEU56DRAFT_929802 [Suillus clintonianus]KAG2119206.1 hypothetical protein DEU56DRAFT_929802 [Suillus clintonianus]
MANFLARYDLEQFKWKPFKGEGGQNGCVRPLGGSEHAQDILDRHFKGDQTLFFAVIVDLHIPVSITKLSSSAQESWCWLRFQIPTVASSVNGSDHELPTLSYTTASPQEINRWAQRTLIVHSPSHIDLDQLRANEGQKKVPSSDGDYTWLHLVPGEIADGTVSKFGLLFHTHHSPFDGVGIKIVANRYLAQLAKVLSDSHSASESIEWGNELKNLPSAAYNILNSNESLPIPPDSLEEPSFDHEYYKSLGSVLSAFGGGMKDTYGFRARPNDTQWPKTRRAEVLFTKEESERIQTASKIFGFTLTHLVHAALAMVVIADNPPDLASSTHYLNNMSLVNFRGRLDSNHSLHPGYVLGVSMTRIPVSAFMSHDGSVFPLDRDRLLKVADIAKEQYRAHIELSAGLSCMPAVGEVYASNIIPAALANMLPPNQCYSFSSDGKGENYLNPTFADDTGKPVFSIAKFFTSVNRFDPGPFFRLSSWGGMIDLSADYNSNLVKTEDITNYLNQWKRFIFLILD